MADNSFLLVDSWSGSGGSVVLGRDITEVTTPDLTYFLLLVGVGWAADLADFTYGAISDDQPRTGWDDACYSWTNDPGVLAYNDDWSLFPSVLGLNAAGFSSMAAQDEWYGIKLVMYPHAAGTVFSSPLAGASAGEEMTLCLIRGGNVVPAVQGATPGLNVQGAITWEGTEGLWGNNGPPTYDWNDEFDYGCVDCGTDGGVLVGFLAAQEGQTSGCGFHFDGVIPSTGVLPTFAVDFSEILGAVKTNITHEWTGPPCVSSPSSANTHGSIGLGIVTDDGVHDGDALAGGGLIEFGQQGLYHRGARYSPVGAPCVEAPPPAPDVVHLGGTRVKTG